MANINSYPIDNTIHANDKLIGTDGNAGAGYNTTKNFTVGGLKDYIISFVDGNNTLSTTVTLTPAQMLSLNGGGAIELLPTPDTGKGYLLTDTFTKIEHNTTAYNFVYSPTIIYYNTETSQSVIYGYWGSLERYILNDLYPGANLEDTFSRNVPPASTTPIIIRQMPIYLKSGSSETVSQGDATVKIILEYRLIDLLL